MTQPQNGVATVAPRWRAYVPGLALVTSYRRAWLPKDVVAGLVLSALLVPQGMAYAELAGLPPVTGLYTSILCLLGYAIFGPSRVLVLGPDSALGPMIAATILPLLLAGGDPARAVALASLLAVLVGVVMVVAGLARFGFVADLLSKPTQIGYMNGLALTIVVGQLPKLLGFSVDADGLRGRGAGLRVGARAGRGERDGRRRRGRLSGRHPAAESAAAQAAERPDRRGAGRRRGQRVRPGGPRASTRSACSRRASRRSRFPLVSWSDVPPLLLGALAIAVVALADTMSTASAFAARRGEQVRGNQEMIGIGAANIAAGFFQGFPVSTSGSRTAVAEQAGSRSQVTGLVGAVVITVVLVFATGADAVRAPADAGRHRHRRRALAGRRRRNASAVAAAPDGVLAVDHRAARRRPPRCAARHPGGGGPVHPQRLPPHLVAAPGRARPRRRASPDCTTPRAIPTPSCCPVWSSTASTHR